jgi:hypothetical protein
VRFVVWHEVPKAESHARLAFPRIEECATKHFARQSRTARHDANAQCRIGYDRAVPPGQTIPLNPVPLRPPGQMTSQMLLICAPFNPALNPGLSPLTPSGHI